VRAEPSALFDALLAAPSVLVTGPANPDGDSIGACLALARALAGRGPAVAVAGEPGWRYAWLPGADAMRADPPAPRGSAWSVVVVLDGDRHRLSAPMERAFNAATTRAIIDHHGSTDPDEYDLAWLDGDATSTCEMLYGEIVARSWPIDLDTATLLHLGSVFDTGCFRHDNTTPRTLAMAADLIGRGVDHSGLATRVLAARRWRGLQAAARVASQARRLLDGRLIVGAVPLDLARELDLAKDDLEGLVEALADVVGAHVGALLVEQPDGTAKISLRSRDDVDVRAVARELSPSGGGHRKASGARTNLSLAQAEAALTEAVRSALLPG
jgi:bifunctional oligoribonuclease and PAP phosphatase NrnA